MSTGTPSYDNPLSYTGINPKAQPSFVRVARIPTTNDYIEFELGDIWEDISVDPRQFYILANVSGNNATWKQIQTATGGGTGIEQILPDAGTSPVVPDGGGNVTISGGTGVQTVGGTNSLSIELTGGTASESFAVPSGTSPVVPDGTGLITLTAGSGVSITGGLNTYAIALSGGGAGVDTVIPDAGINVVPDGSGNISVLGAPGRTFTGTTNVLTLTDLRDLSSFVVNSTVGSEYLTIQSAINAAVADGASTTNPRVVYVTTGLTGQYAENITLADGIHVQATTEFSFTGGIKIVGQAGSAAVTMPLSGAASLKGFIVEAAAGQAALEQTAATTNVIQFEATNCSFDATANVGTYGVDIDNGGSGNAVTCFFGNCRFTGSTADFRGGAGLTCSNRNFFMEGAVKGLELARGANFTGWSFNIDSYVTVDASTFTGIIGGIGDTGVTPPNAQIDLIGASTVILANTRISTLSNPSIRIGENATVNHFFSAVVNVGAGTNFVTKGAGAGVATYRKGGVYVVGNVIGIDPTIDVVITPIQY